jgi:hypothetical protein
MSSGLCHLQVDVGDEKVEEIMHGKYQPPSDIRPLPGRDRISKVWEQPPDESQYIHVFVGLPDEHIDKRPRLDASGDDIPWLKKLHSEIWGRQDRKAECLRQVKVTREHYDALQTTLLQKYPNRETPQYDGQDHFVVSNKLDIIRPTAEPLHPDNEEGRVDGVDNPEAIEDDFELDSLFPSTLRYLDLSTLNLKEKSPRFPSTLFLRREYDHITRLIDERPNKNFGSVIISGQPGTGEVIFSPCLARSN